MQTFFVGYVSYWLERENVEIKLYVYEQDEKMRWDLLEFLTLFNHTTLYKCYFSIYTFYHFIFIHILNELFCYIF